MEKSVLITGPAGSGKTAECLRICSESLERSGPGAVLCLVPSAEAVRDMEKRLFLEGRLRGVLGALTTDFAGLALRILKEAGFAPLHRIGLLEKRYLILRILREAPLRFFGEVRDYEGFADVVANFIAELKRGMISPEDFLEGCLAAGGRGGIPDEKVRELHAIYAAYHDSLKRTETYDADGLQWKAAELLAADPSLLSRVSVLLVDGFATYTPVESRILTHLIERAGESHITLCYEEKRPEVFGFVEGTYARLRKLCTAAKVVSSGDRRPVEALVHLERTLFGEPKNGMSAGGAVSIIACPDPYREVETVAREIERIRREDGLRYGDFMVIFRDVNPYLRAVVEVFSDRRVPFFFPASGCAAEEPFVRAVVSALQLLKGEFRRDNVLAVLKNSYLHADMDIAAAVENYADEFGLWEEGHFRETWTQAGETADDPSPLTEHKAGFLEVLDRLRTEAGGISSAQEFRRFVYRVIRELGFLSRSQNTGRECGRPPTDGGVFFPSLSPECGALTSLARVLDTMCEYASLAAWPGADYGMLTEMLERGLVWTPVPSSPRGADSVRVVPIVGGPPPAAPVVFVCGLCERSFPREIVSEPFFKDRERRLVTERGKIVLDERSSLSSGERFFFYFAVSRATGRLVLTYPTADGAGKELARSHYVEEVVRLFSDLPDATEAKAPAATVAPELAAVADADELRAFVACQLSRPIRETEEDRDEGPTLASLAYNELLKGGGFGPDDLVYQVSPEKLSGAAGHGPESADTYFTSVSELETFGRCPFRHFCEYRLGLRELRRYEFGHAEEGLLYHEILARLYREIYLPSRDDRGVPEEADRPPRGIENLLPEYVEERLAVLMDQLLRENYSRLFRPRRMQVRRRALHARIRDFVLKELENERANATRPTYFELSFGKGRGRENADPRSSRACLTLRGTERVVRVSGRMDRVDVFARGEERFGVVVDYKRSTPSSRLDLQSGTVLQPGIYMLALKELFGLQPAGAFYYAISSGRKRGVFAQEDEESISGQGDVSRTDRASYEEIGELMKLNARQAAEYVQRILEGEKAVRPADRNECRTCPFRSACRISEQTR